MRYNAIDKALFELNRKRFAEQMSSGGIALFHSNDFMPRNGDAYHNWKQNSDLFYLSGVDQEETILVLFSRVSSSSLPRDSFYPQDQSYNRGLGG